MFLSEEQSKLQKQIKKGKGFFKNLARKFSGNEEFNLSSPKKVKDEVEKYDLDIEEKQRLNIFLGTMKDLQSKKLKMYSKIEIIMEKLHKQYKALSKTIFKLADTVGELSSNSEKIEKLCSGNFKNVALHSQTFNTFKVALYSWSHEMSQTQSNFKKNFEPLMKGLHKETIQIKDVKNNLN